MAVRTRRLFTYHTVGTAGLEVAFTCPLGRTALIRQLLMLNRSTSASNTITLGVSGQAVWRGVFTQNEARQLPNLAINPGETLSLQSSIVNGATVAGFGSLLFGEPE